MRELSVVGKAVRELSVVGKAGPTRRDCGLVREISGEELPPETFLLFGKERLASSVAQAERSAKTTVEQEELLPIEKLQLRERQHLIAEQLQRVLPRRIAGYSLASDMGEVAIVFDGDPLSGPKEVNVVEGLIDAPPQRRGNVDAAVHDEIAIALTTAFVREAEQDARIGFHGRARPFSHEGKHPAESASPFRAFEVVKGEAKSFDTGKGKRLYEACFGSAVVSVGSAKLEGGLCCGGGTGSDGELSEAEFRRGDEEAAVAPLAVQWFAGKAEPPNGAAMRKHGDARHGTRLPICCMEDRGPSEGAGFRRRFRRATARALA